MNKLGANSDRLLKHIPNNGLNFNRVRIAESHEGLEQGETIPCLALDVGCQCLYRGTRSCDIIDCDDPPTGHKDKVEGVTRKGDKSF